MLKLAGDSGMIFNQETCKWEGNEDDLNPFEPIPTTASSRPTLIKAPAASLFASPAAGTARFGEGAQVVGDMKFDPEKMCWVSNLDEDEVDVFEGMADDEDDEPGGGATITRTTGKKLVSVGGSGGGRLASESSASTGTGMGTGWSMGVDEGLRRECRDAERRHGVEMKGWIVEEGRGKREEREVKRLWEIWQFATEDEE